MIDRKQLLASLRGEVALLEGDLREQVGALEGLERRLRGEHAAATTARRTSATWASWRDEQVTQAAVACVLGTVFVRWCEDNALIDPVLSGPGERLGDAEDAQLGYFRTHPHRTDADWLRAGFGMLAASDAGATLFDARHNPACLIPVSHDGAKGLIGFWRARRGDGSLLHDFGDPGWDTRFLGDLYQDLSEAARDRFALLQTPGFVQEFIFDLTLSPAIEEFSLDGLRVIDPTCGSRAFPARHLPPAGRRLAGAGPGTGPVRGGPPGAGLGARRGPQPVRGDGLPVPAADRRLAYRRGHHGGAATPRCAAPSRKKSAPSPSTQVRLPDFTRTEYWRHRGKLDVPKERFVSYPAATRDGDGALLLGWAGWDHREQAQALAVLITQRRGEDGGDRDRIVPLLAGLAELLPWVAQWHGEFDPAFGGSPAELYQGFLNGQLTELHLSRGDLTTWRPAGRVDVAPLPRKRATPSPTSAAPV